MIKNPNTQQNWVIKTSIKINKTMEFYRVKIAFHKIVFRLTNRKKVLKKVKIVMEDFQIIWCLDGIDHRKSSLRKKNTIQK